MYMKTNTDKTHLHDQNIAPHTFITANHFNLTAH